MANEIIVKYFDIKEYNIDMLLPFTQKISLRYEKCSRYLNEKTKLQSLLAGLLIYQNMGDIESKIQYNKYGKPYLDEDKNYFNISHTGDYVVFVKDEKNIGIDIERIREKNLSIINRAFNDKEIKLINGNVAELTKLWTIKESVYKASGAENYLDFKNIDTSNEIEVVYNRDKYNVISKKVDECYLSIASINKYDNIILQKETL